jgi:dihydroorotate dehydrogenase
VEFGSFTRWPRIGNAGTVLWRDVQTRSTQNRVGLKNPGAKAAAAFLSQHRTHLPPCFGINVAVSPGVVDPVEERREVLECLDAFLQRGVLPSWFTLNLSCPNTGDDPGGNQTEEKALDLCGSVVERLRYASVDVGYEIPLWVKIGPTLAWEQYRRLMHAFHQVGVRAVVATNTLPAATPGDPTVSAGISGGSLHARAIQVACELSRESQQRGYGIDVIGCGGVLDGDTLLDFAHYDIRAVQYLSALIYRGPLAAATIWNEAYHARS